MIATVSMNTVERPVILTCPRLSATGDGQSAPFPTAMRGYWGADGSSNRVHEVEVIWSALPTNPFTHRRAGKFSGQAGLDLSLVLLRPTRRHVYDRRSFACPSGKNYPGNMMKLYSIQLYSWRRKLKGRRGVNGVMVSWTRGEEVSPIRCTFAGQHPFNFPCSSRRCELAFSSRIL